MLRRLSVLTCVTILTAAGCGGSGGSDLTKDRTPEQILSDAQGAAAGQSQFRFTVEGSTTSTVSTSQRTPSTVIRALAGGITASGQGTVNDRDAIFDFDATLAQLPSFQGNVTKVGGQLFVGILGTDYRVTAPERQVHIVRPALIPSGLLTWITAPRLEGREEIDGVETVRMTGEVDLDVVSRDTLNALAVLPTSTVTPADIRRSIPEVRRALTKQSVEMWIGTEDLLPRRVVVDLTFDGRVTALPELSKGSLQFDVRFSEYGTAVTISAPSTDRTIDPNAAGSLLG